MGSNYFFNLRRISDVYSNTLKLPSFVRVALVLEGGGQRCAFSAGVTDAFIQGRFDPFSRVYGVSGGAQVASTYLAKRPMIAKRIVSELTTHQRFYRKFNWFSGEPLMDLDWYFDQAQNHPRYGLIDPSESCFDRISIVTSCREQFEPIYLGGTGTDLVSALKASSAIPFFYHQGVQIQGRHLVDGGLAHPIPVSQAANEGHELIITIRTTPEMSIPEPIFSKQVHQFFKRANRGTLIGEMMEVHENNYQRDTDYAAKPLDDVVNIQITPDRVLQTTTLGSNAQQIDADYQLGFQTGVLFVNTWGQQVLKTAGSNSIEAGSTAA